MLLGQVLTLMVPVTVVAGLDFTGEFDCRGMTFSVRGGASVCVSNPTATNWRMQLDAL